MMEDETFTAGMVEEITDGLMGFLVEEIERQRDAEAEQLVEEFKRVAREELGQVDDAGSVFAVGLMMVAQFSRTAFELMPPEMTGALAPIVVILDEVMKRVDEVAGE